MTLSSLYFGAIWATMRRDATIFMSYRLRMLTQVLGMLFSLTTFYFIAKLVRANAVGGHDNYYAYVVVGIVIVAVLMAALTTAQVVRMELMQGNFERILISPLGPVGGVIAVAAFPILYAVCFAALMLVLAAAIFGIPLQAGGVPLALLVTVIGSLAFASIGFLFVAALLAFKAAAGATWVVTGLSLLGGAYFPARLFPGWIRWVSQVQPFTPAVDLLRHLLVGTPSLQPVWIELLKLAGFAAVLMPASLAVLRLAVTQSRKRGTIMEY